MFAEWDGFRYYTDDKSFIDSIKFGKCEPYDHGENSQLNLVKKYLKKYNERNRTMLDIGAHIGSTMLPYSKLFSNVIGFEPNKKNYNFCVKNLEFNKATNCSIENCAIFNRKFTGTTVQHNNCNSGCFYFKENTNNIDEIIETKILDDDEKINNVDFIKIDTEGAEYFVILGALEIIKKYKPLIQAEINGLCQKNFNISEETLLKLLKSLNYKRIEKTDFFYHIDYDFFE